MSVSKKEQFQVSSYSRRLRDNVKSILENYSEILKASKAGITHHIIPNLEIKCIMTISKLYIAP